MRLSSVAVLGGGPGGLYAARLMKLRRPECAVTVYEQSPPSGTFGFGVGLATATQRHLEKADPVSLRAIVADAWRHEMSMSVGDVTVTLPAGDLIAIGRARLLEILRDQALAAGVEIHDGTRVSAEELDADLVIAADGVNSATRERFGAELGVRIDRHDSLYLWCGTDFALPRAVFRPEVTGHGTFVAHAYPYQRDRSTFLVETDPGTWRRAGFDATTDRTAPDQSDETALDHLSDVFADTLRGHRLIGNRTRWLRFRTVTCETWHHGNVVLLGDAAHTAHYSIGSGTKLAMESGIALVEALDAGPDLESALTAYETARRPAVEHLQDTARRSMRWWDEFPERLDLPVEQLLIAYMTRAGKVSLERLARDAPAVVAAGLARYDGGPVERLPDDVVGWVLDRPLDADGQHWPTRAVPCGGLHESEKVTALDAGTTRESALAAFDAAERVRRTGRLVGVRVPDGLRGLAAEALAGGRVDLVELV
ncbi:anthraniloyl-CoA monooxygenase [Streptomyces aurantiacus]|uniref:FAD-dependent monooxygenase n=1 Tax=Streptomyces aurantiacus TaxID=47760 RepID=UPI00278F3CE5|nr:FAD-dependent monooxygenase [Streptomyces aurantiacus]MDQ0772740.1 anthraniloyl-CoA monooxygenase [Streptomyces aurantiacus]